MVSYECHACKQVIPEEIEGEMPVKMVPGQKKFEWVFECTNCYKEPEDE